MANTFKFGNGNWAVKEDYALAYNDENGNFKPLPFDFTRASTATRVNKQGLVETVPSGKPRIDFLNNTSGHLLLEPSRKNDITDYTGASFSAFNGATITANDSTSPDGSANATLMTTTGGANELIQQASITILSGQSYTVSGYFKLKSGTLSDSDNAFKGLDGLNGGGITGSTFNSTLTSEWQRLSFTVTSSTTSGRVQIKCEDEAEILVWGLQVEQGSYATSLIPTSGSTVTRSAEYAVDAGNSTVFSDTELSWFLDIEGFAEDGTTRYISISDGGGSPYTNGYAVQYRSDGNLRIFRNGLDFADAICIVDIDQTIRQKIAIRFKQNDMKVYINGISQSLNGSYVFQSMSGIDRMRTNQQNSTSGSNAFDGKIYEMRVWNEALSDSELQALTSG